MRYVKILGLLAITATALLAVAPIASATQLTSPGGTVYTGSVEAEAKELSMHGVANYTCKRSPAKGHVVTHGSSSTAAGVLTSWAFEECSPGHVLILENGTLTIHTQEEGANNNGIVTSTGAKVESVSTNMGITCIYSTNETQIGVFTGSNSKNATVVVDSALIPRTGGSIFCGSSSEITGTYVITTPSTLSID